MRRTAIGQIIPRDRRHNGMNQFQAQNKLCNPLRLSEFHRFWITAYNRTEMARARAYFAQYHHCCRMPRPTLASIRTPGALAYGIKSQTLQKVPGIFNRLA
jgi:hypothetical protein